ncbi:MAG TPA: glutamate synthase central domain-containing protein, partial [Vicinamibacterales bacterium]|nr:glutamate synthase central domain-containing protein [Vicinamibacterales bacterium]
MCGVGFIATTGRAATRAIVEDGLLALRRLTHRGAQASLGSVDGCGVMTAIPWRLLDRSAEASRSAGVSGSAGCRALGMFFVRGGDRPAAEDIIERDLRVAGAAAVVWRDVPTDAAAVLPAQRGTAPAVLQAIAAFSEDESVVARALYRARVRIERTAADRGLSLDVVSLSTRTVVHKALVAPDALDVFYPDLSSDAFESTFITFHQRFSTNTSANWALAQPFRTLAHNGEINTIVGNRTWMRARFLDRTSITGFEGERPVSAQGSDSRSLDDAVGLLQYRGSSIAHALSRLVPPAWERDESLTPEVRAFHQFQSLVSEPWDGPSALVFADGRFVGAALDRNGFRPARVVKTADGVVALASEVGVLSERHEIVDRGRLGPGGMLIVDLERGRVLQTAQIRRALARRRPYAKLVSSVVQRLPTDARRGEQARPRHAAVLQQQLFGISREEIELLLKPMAVDGHEAVGSMGDDTPPAVLSSRPRLFTDYFRQRFAQVTNPPIDPYRESAVMSLTSVLGAHGDYVDELSPRPRRVVLGSPVLDSAEIRALMTMPGLSSRSIDTTIEAASAGSGDAIEGCLDRIVSSACDAVQSGCAILVFSDRGAGRERAPLPALLVVSTVHHALIARGLRLRASIVADTGDVRDAHQLAALCAFGASAVCPWLAFETVAAPESCDHASDDGAPGRYRRALERGLLTVMSKMGVCTFSGYCGSSLFEVIGLHASVVDRCFHGTPSPIGGAGFAEIAAAIAERHRRACASGGGLDYPGLHGYRRDGEYHANNPVVVR